MQPDCEPATLAEFPQRVSQWVFRMRRAEDEVILASLLVGAASDSPCGVRVRRKLDGPTEVAVDPEVPPWEVHEHAAGGGAAVTSSAVACLRCEVHESTEWTCTCDGACGHPLCAERCSRSDQ